MHESDEIKNRIFSATKEYYLKYLKDKKPPYIPASGKKFDEKELISGINAVLDGWWTEGKITEEFETKFNHFLSIKYSLIVNSGSSANLLALKTLTSKKLGKKRLIKGDEVITAAAGFPTTINPILNCQCIPVFCDIELKNYNIKIEDLRNAISDKTKAIILAHTLGNPFNLEAVKKVCEEFDLWLIEDTCDALGSQYNEQYVGTFGDLGTFSFYPAHHITMGEGGAVITNDTTLYKIAKSLRDWGRDCWCGTGQDNTCGKRFDWKLGKLPYGYDHKYIYSEIGYNLKNTDLNVAIGLAQLDKLNDFIIQRRNNFEYLYHKMNKYSRFFYLPEATINSNPCWFGFILTLKPDVSFKRLELLRFLEENKIATRLLFGGNILRQPYFVDYEIKYRIIGDLKNTDYVMNNTFWIGVCPLITKKDIDQMDEMFKVFFNSQPSMTRLQ